MANTFSDNKHRALLQRLAQLLEEYEAANAQRGRTLSEVDRLRIQRQITALEDEIQNVEAELRQEKAVNTTADGDASPMLSSTFSSAQPEADPAGLYNRIREALLQCQEFDSNQAMIDFFAHPDLYPFRNLIPQTTDRRSRVQGVMAKLRHQRRRDGRHALVILLYALGDAYSQDLMHQAELVLLADKLRLVIQDGRW
jgi:hypothetical protein